MLAVVLSLLVILSLAVAVVALVAVPARRAGREVLTDRGEAVVDGLLERLPTRGESPAPSPDAPAEPVEREPVEREAVGSRA